MLSQHLGKRQRKVLSISTRTLRMMFSLSSVGGVQITRDDVSSHLKYYQLSSELLDDELILFRSSHFDHVMEKKYNSYWYVLNIRTL